MGKSEHEREARKTLVKRAERLIELANLDAPEIMLCSEVMMIYSCLPLFEDGYRHILTAKSERKLAKEKNKKNLCMEKNCYNEIPLSIKGKYGDQRCYKCQKKADEENLQYEEN